MLLYLPTCFYTYLHVPPTPGRAERARPTYIYPELSYPCGVRIVAPKRTERRCSFAFRLHKSIPARSCIFARGRRSGAAFTSLEHGECNA